MNPYFSDDFLFVTIGLASLGGALLISSWVGRNPLELVWGRQYAKPALDQAANSFGWLLLLLAAINLVLAFAGPAVGFRAYITTKLLIVMPISGMAAWWIGRRLSAFRIDPPR